MITLGSDRVNVVVVVVVALVVVASSLLSLLLFLSDVLDQLGVGEQLVHAVEEDEQHAVTDVHRGTQHDANVLQAHLVDRRLKPVCNRINQLTSETPCYEIVLEIILKLYILVN